MKPVPVIISGVFLMACNFSQSGDNFYISHTSQTIDNEDSSYKTISSIPLPAGYKRIIREKESFGNWLRTIRLKKDKTVYLYNGDKKKYQRAQFAVLDISVGNRDLQQCADAVMRLRAEYLFEQKRYTEISFRDNDGKSYNFSEPFTTDNFHHYLNTIFSACGTSSLSKQLHSKALNDLHAGDVLIKGGFPGHAVIIVDAAVNDKNQVIYLLAQSYMPAQDIHVLVNPMYSDISPWYKVDESERIITPEYVFYPNQLKEW